ncbi:MAG: V-type ATP synthase subunit D [Nitrososphaerales archaeon]
MSFGGKAVPTKLELIRLRRRLSVSRKVHKILEDKREVLLHKLDELVDEATNARDMVWKTLPRAYSAINEAYLSAGPVTVDSIAITTPVSLQSLVQDTNMMGVPIPALDPQWSDKGEGPTYGFSDTSSSLDGAIMTMRSILKEIFSAAQMENSIFRLAEELKKTQRQINALEYLIIPRYQSSISFIYLTLEEREREEFTRLKSMKRILGSRKEVESIPVVRKKNRR